jgi:hypothetical protein
MSTFAIDDIWEDIYVQNEIHDGGCRSIIESVLS